MFLKLLAQICIKGWPHWAQTCKGLSRDLFLRSLTELRSVRTRRAGDEDIQMVALITTQRESNQRNCHFEDKNQSQTATEPNNHNLPKRSHKSAKYLQIMATERPKLQNPHVLPATNLVSLHKLLLRSAYMHAHRLGNSLVSPQPHPWHPNHRLLAPAAASHSTWCVRAPGACCRSAPGSRLVAPSHSLWTPTSTRLHRCRRAYCHRHWRPATRPHSQSEFCRGECGHKWPPRAAASTVRCRAHWDWLWSAAAGDTCLRSRRCNTLQKTKQHKGQLVWTKNSNFTFRMFYKLMFHMLERAVQSTSWQKKTRDIISSGRGSAIMSAFDHQRQNPTTCFHGSTTTSAAQNFRYACVKTWYIVAHRLEPGMMPNHSLSFMGISDNFRPVADPQQMFFNVSFGTYFLNFHALSISWGIATFPRNWHAGYCIMYIKIDDVVLRHTLPVFTGLGRCPIVSWDFVGAVSIFGPDALPVVHQWLLPGLEPATSWVRVAAHNH